MYPSWLLIGLVVAVLASVPDGFAQKKSKRLLPAKNDPAVQDSVLPLMPAAARQTILSEAALAEIEDCERITEDGEFVYEVSYLRGGVERSFTVAPDGSLRSKQYFRKELPPAVQQTLSALEARGIIGDIYWCNEDGDLVYEVEVGVGDAKRMYSVSSAGTHLATQRLMNELPEATQKAIRAQVGNDLLIAIARDETEIGEVYDVVMRRNDRRHIVSINAAGVVVATQILIVQAPAAVQDTITKTAGAAQIVYIGQCEEEGGTCYAVITYRGTRRDEFVVDAEGKLLARVIAFAALSEPAQKYLREQAGNARIARIEQLPDGTFSADLDRRGKKQVITFIADGTSR